MTPLMYRVVLVVAMVFAVAMALLPHPPAMPTERLGDKVNHMLAFAALTGLAAKGFPAASPWRIAERLSFVGALIEVLQALPALHRDCDIRDWIADTLAIAAVLLLVRAYRRHRDGPDAAI